MVRLQPRAGSLPAIAQRRPSGADLKIGRPWAIKEDLRHFWQYRDKQPGSKHWKHWYFWATHSRLKPMIDAARTLKRHEAGLYTPKPPDTQTEPGRAIRMRSGRRSAVHFSAIAWLPSMPLGLTG
ncbi:MAG: transposase [Solirubrobacteraceae bacterium]